MTKAWKVFRLAGAPKGKEFGVFRAADVVGLKSPLEPDEAPCVIANCTAAEARRYASDLEAGESIESVRARRLFYKNMMHSGMN